MAKLCQAVRQALVDAGWRGWRVIRQHCPHEVWAHPDREVRIVVAVASCMHASQIKAAARGACAVASDDQRLKAPERQLLDAIASGELDQRLVATGDAIPLDASCSTSCLYARKAGSFGGTNQSLALWAIATVCRGLASILFRQCGLSFRPARGVQVAGSPTVFVG